MPYLSEVFQLHKTVLETLKERYGTVSVSGGFYLSQQGDSDWSA